MRETGRGGIQEKIRLELGKYPDLLLFRNQGGLTEHEGRVERYGLAPGASDLIGVRTIRIGPEHVGLAVGRFFALEVKAPGKKPTDEQKRFLKLIRRFGGHGAWADSVEGALHEYRSAARR